MKAFSKSDADGERLNSPNKIKTQLKFPSLLVGGKTIRKDCKMMLEEKKMWKIEYSHADGRSGIVKAVTEIDKSGGFDYGNGKCGALIIDGYPTVYDLRYNTSKDLHMAMLKDYFGKGLVKATEI